MLWLLNELGVLLSVMSHLVSIMGAAGLFSCELVLISKFGSKLVARRLHILASLHLGHARLTARTIDR